MCQGPSTSVQQRAPREKKASAMPVKGPTIKRGGRKDPTLVAGKEAIGRPIAIWSNKAMEWAKATIAQFNAEKGQHLVRFSEREPGSVKHAESWLLLSKTRFQWLEKPPANMPPNPTNAGAPKGEEAVGYKVRVFWPGMARWYLGTVQAYEMETGLHTVKYRDGDVQKLKLRNEAVVYLEKKSNQRDKTKVTKIETAKTTGGKRSRISEKVGKASLQEPESSTSNPQKKRKLSVATGGNSTTTSEGVGQTGKGSATASGTLSSTSTHSMNNPKNGEMKSVPKNQNDSKLPEKKKIKDQKKKESKKDGTKKDGRPQSNQQRSSVSSPRPRGRPPGSGNKGSSLNRKAINDRKHVRSGNANEEVIKVSGSSVVGARVAIFWNDDIACSKGKIIQFDSYHKRHKIMYDDGEEEWVALPREIFRYLSPRAKSAGCTPAFRTAMSDLGADQESGRSKLRLTDTSLNGTKELMWEVCPDFPPPEKATGWKVSLKSASDGRWHGAEVLCYDSSNKKHCLLYDDGEDEWVNFDEEEVRWHHPSGVGASVAFPGKSPGLPNPSKEKAIGWRIAVFCPDKKTFSSGVISSFSEETGKHDVSYDDRQDSSIIIGEEKVKWILPPASAMDQDASDKSVYGSSRSRRRAAAIGIDTENNIDFERQLHQRSSATGVMAGRGTGGRRGRGRGRGRGSDGGRGHSGFASAGWDKDDSTTRDIYSGIPAALKPHMGFLQYQFTAGDSKQNNDTVDEGICGEPVVLRKVCRIPSFASPMLATNDTSDLPSPLNVRIYLSRSPGFCDKIKSIKEKYAENSDQILDLAKTKSTSPESPNEVSKPDGEAVSKDVEGCNEKTDSIDNDSPSQSERKQAEFVDKQRNKVRNGVQDDNVVVSSPFLADSIATSDCNMPEKGNDKKKTQKCNYEKKYLELELPSERWQGRLKALDLMNRRVGRAQQAIIKGIPTDLPTHVVRPLRTGPPPGMRAIAARGSMHSAHRLARASGGISHLSIRRRALEEEDEEEEESYITEATSDLAIRENETTDLSNQDQLSIDVAKFHQKIEEHKTINQMQSSSGSSDIDENSDEPQRKLLKALKHENSPDVVVSPRTLAFSRGSKVKPSTVAYTINDSHELHNGLVGQDTGATSYLKTELQTMHSLHEDYSKCPGVGGSGSDHVEPFTRPLSIINCNKIRALNISNHHIMSTPSEDANNAAADSSSHGEDLSMEEIQVVENGGFAASDSVGNLFSMAMDGNFSNGHFHANGFGPMDLNP